MRPRLPPLLQNPALPHRATLPFPEYSPDPGRRRPPVLLPEEGSVWRREVPGRAVQAGMEEYTPKAEKQHRLSVALPSKLVVPVFSAQVHATPGAEDRWREGEDAGAGQVQ